MGFLTVQRPDADTLAFKSGLAALLGYPPTNVFFVNANAGAAASTNSGTSPLAPLTTIALALAKCSANNGDVVYVFPGHTETLGTTTQGLSVATAGVTIMGGGDGRARPAITCGAADVSGIVVSAANCKLKNLRLIGSTSQTTTTSVILSLTSTDTVLEDVVQEHGGAGPLCATSMTAAHRTVMRRCKWLGTSAGPDVGIRVTSTSNDCIFEYIDMQYGVSVGLDSAGLITGTSAALPGVIFRHIDMVGMDVGGIDINFSTLAVATGTEGIIRNAYVACTAANTIAAAFDLGSTAIFDSFYTDLPTAPPIWAGSSVRNSANATCGMFPAGAVVS